MTLAGCGRILIHVPPGSYGSRPICLSMESHGASIQGASFVVVDMNRCRSLTFIIEVILSIIGGSMKKATWLSTTLVVVVLLVAAFAGVFNVHSHAESNDQSCTLCQALHLRGSLATVPALSCLVLQIAATTPSETQRTFPTLPPSLTYRGPPLFSSTS